VLVAERAEPAGQAALGEAAGGPLAFTFGSWFMWTAIGLAFPALGVALIVASGSLAAGAYETRPAFVAAHLATLAWGTMTIIGAATQMAPALLGARIPAERTLPWLYALFTAGVATVAAGLASARFGVAAAGGAAINLAAWWFISLLVAGIASAGPKRAVLSPQIPAALLCLILVLLWGTMLAANLRRPFWPGLLIAHRGLVVHLALGLGGWFGFMVIGVFYRLVPLIHGARVARAGRGAVVLLVAALALAAVLGGVGGALPWLLRASALLAAAALVLFTAEIVHVLAHRRRRMPDLNVMHWYAVAVYSIMLALIGAGWGAGRLRTDPPDRLGEVTVSLFLLGWMTQAIVGQLYKITPFLMWYYRATIPDVLAIPRQPAPYYPGPGRAVFWLSNLGAAGLALGLWSGVRPVAEAGAACVAAAAFVLAYMLAYRWIPPAATGALTFEWRWRIS
jgi:hypothetical protein